MLTRLATKRLLPQSTMIATLRRTLVARPVAPCSYSRRDEVMSNWEALRANPAEWFDNRNRKTNPRAPDFVRKDDRAVAIWVDGRDNPDWSGEVLEELDSRQMGQGQGRGDRAGGDRASFDGAGGDRNDRRAVEQANWEALRNYPEEWFDNRNRKTNPKAPDFRRRDDRSVALWLDSYGAPDWVGDLLQELDARQAQRAGGYPQQQQGDGQQAPQQYMEDKRAAEMAKWESLRANPELWFDNRRTKTNPKAPDFKLKEDRTVALWLSSYQLPEYVDELMAYLDARYEQRMIGQQQYQQQQQEYQQGGNPQEQGYAQGQQQDYQQQQQAGGGFEAKRAEEMAKWESLRANPEQWFDNRYSKPNSKWPDFRRKDDRTTVLWLSSRVVPEWIDDLILDLDARHQERESIRASGTNYATNYTTEPGY